MDISREQERINRIAVSFEKLLKRIEAEPDHPRREDWERRIEEYKTSLTNFEAFGVERPVKGKPGVNLQVPLGRFGLKGG
jgi:hypothetical protein